MIPCPRGKERETIPTLSKAVINVTYSSWKALHIVRE